MKRNKNRILTIVAGLLLVLSCICGAQYAVLAGQQPAEKREEYFEIEDQMTPLSDAGKADRVILISSMPKESQGSANGINVFLNLNDKTTNNYYFNLSDFKLWESGEYSSSDGTAVDNKRRLRYPGYFAATEKKYYVFLSEKLRINISEYSSSMKLLQTVTCHDGSVYKPSKDAACFSITLYRSSLEKELSPGQWRKLFDKGLCIILSTTPDYSNEGEEIVIPGSADSSKQQAEDGSDKKTGSAGTDKSDQGAVIDKDYSINIDENSVINANLGKSTGFYLNLSFFQLWEVGEYSTTNGVPSENKRRLRYTKFIAVSEPEYLIIMSEDYRLNILEYSSEKKAIKAVTVSGGDIYRPSAKAAYFSITLYRSYSEKELSYGQWADVFSRGITISICTEEWKDYSIAKEGSLISFDSELKKLSKNEYSDLLLEGKDSELASLLWHDQLSSGMYTLTGEELDNGRVTYFFSSSEGNDNNTGLSKDCPKKSFEGFNGVSNANILLKCGDVFEMENGFSLGSNCIMAAYGEGERPVLNFYRNLELTFTRCEENKNLWVADMSAMDICTGQDNKDNCNIGQLIVDGEINWKRYVWSSKYAFDSAELIKRADNGWAVDWTNSKLYWYSTDDPNKKDIIYAPPVTAITLTRSKNVVIKGIEIVGAGRHACNMTNCDSITVSCCYFHEIGGSAHVNSGSRYGNAFQIWDSGTNIYVHDNYVAWIFDTCFTHQGGDVESMVENVYFDHNIGAHFFWGIEAWGDNYSNNDFRNVNYTNNILFDNIDVTNPNEAVYSKANTRVVFSDPKKTLDDYISYRNGYYYHQMSSINISNSGTGEITNIDGNIAWNTHRFLVLARDPREEGDKYSSLKNNLLFATVDVPVACLIRMTKPDDTKEYCQEMKYLDSSNTWCVHDVSENYDCTKEKAALEKMIRTISGRSK